MPNPTTVVSSCPFCGGAPRQAVGTTQQGGFTRHRIQILHRDCSAGFHPHNGGFNEDLVLNHSNGALVESVAKAQRQRWEGRSL